MDDSTELPSGFVKDENGHWTGQLFEVPSMKKILGSSPQPKAYDMKMAIEEQWRDYASRGFTTVTDLLFCMKSDDNEETNATLNILKRVSESQFCPVRLALYRALDDSGMSAKLTPSCCFRMVALTLSPDACDRLVFIKLLRSKNNGNICVQLVTQHCCIASRKA